MTARIDQLPAPERVRILSTRLANLKNGSGDFRPVGRAMAIKECARKLEEAKEKPHDLGSRYLHLDSRKHSRWLFRRAFHPLWDGRKNLCPKRA